MSFKKKLYYLFFCIKNFGLFKGVGLWLKFEVFRMERFSVPGKGLVVNLRRNTSDHFAFRHIFLLNEYEHINTNHVKWVIDAGANIGLFSAFIKNKYPDASVVALEPEPSNFAQLQKNTAGFSNFYAENKGLWNKDCKLEVVTIEELGKWGTQVKESAAGNIDAICVESLVAKYKIDVIDILKIDIETSEKFIFDNYNAWLPKVKVVIIEFHDRLLEGTSRPFFEAVLKAFPRFRYSHIGDNVVVENLSIP
jgi:FkbM family methyltransferase